MRRTEYPSLIQELVRQLRRMPGIGPRSAERIALWMIQSDDASGREIADAITRSTTGIRNCSRCGFFSEQELCAICLDPGRDSLLLCVVEQPTDVLPLERTGAFSGLYHALGGKLSPLDHVGPENLRIESLLQRVRSERPQEVILALSADVEGEATASYLGELLSGEAIKITRIAQGLPAGVGLENADDLTLTRAFSGRVVFKS